jgi:hypothetical protein
LRFQSDLAAIPTAVAAIAAALPMEAIDPVFRKMLLMLALQWKLAAQEQA